MRRLRILYYWLFVNKNNVTFKELLAFLIKPKINTIAKRYIEKVEEFEEFEVTFKSINHKLFWPKSFSINRLDQVICETFDTNDWHYYQKQHTQVAQDEIILDIGTAEGLFPFPVIEKCKHVYMVEPSKIFNICLKKTFANFSQKITLFNTAVGNIDGEIAFDENSLEGMIATEQTENINKISIHKIDTLLKNNEKITYLKADIEGFELEMLKGAEQTIKRNKPKIAITTYHIPNNPKEIISLVQSFVPEYKYYVKGIYELTPKPVLIHFWIE